MCAALALVLLGLFLAALVVGDFPFGPSSRSSTHWSAAATRASDFIVYELRLPEP